MNYAESCFQSAIFDLFFLALLITLIINIYIKEDAKLKKKMNKKIKKIKENRNITIAMILFFSIFSLPGCISDIKFYSQFSNNNEISTVIKPQRVYKSDVYTRSIDMISSIASKRNSYRRGEYDTMYNIVTTNGDEFLVLNNENNLSDFYDICKEYEDSEIISDTTLNIKYIDTSRYKIITSVESISK